MKALFFFLVFGLFPSLSFAHAEVVSSIPKAGSKQVVSPTKIDIAFNEPFVLTKVRIFEPTGDFDKGYRYKNLDWMTDHQISIDRLPTGYFTLEWRGLAKDGHIIKGQFQFTVAD